MQKDFWLDRWENQQIGFHQNEVNPHLESFWSLINADSNSRVFVPLCGKSADLVWLTKKGHSVIGVEFSQLAVEAFFDEWDLQYEIASIGKLKSYTADSITILQGDFFDLDSAVLGSVAAVFDRASLIALPELMRSEYCHHLLKITNNAPMLLITMEYDQAQMDGPPFSVPESELDKKYRAQYEINKLDTVDLLQSSPQFKDRGLESLLEKVYKLSPQTV